MDTHPGTETFGRWLDLTMANRDIKGRTLARKLHVHDSAVSRWRSGRGLPSMDTLLKLAQALGVEPLRLAVTAGLMDGRMVGAQPLPLPEPTAQRQLVKEQLNNLRGLTAKEKQRLIEAYDNMGATA